MNRKTPIALLLGAVLAGCGCGSGSGGASSASTKTSAPIVPATVAPGAEASLMPLSEGSSWVYSYDQSVAPANQPDQAVERRFEVTWHIAKLEKVADGTRATIEISDSERTVDRQSWLLNSKGLFQLTGSTDQIAYTPPQPILSFPLKNGEKTKWAGTGALAVGGSGASTATSQVLGAQEVDTDRERVSAIAVQTDTTFKGAKGNGISSAVSWFKPGAGLVRYHSETLYQDPGHGAIRITTTLRLKSSTVKQ